jgi:hypothetical protein
MHRPAKAWQLHQSKFNIKGNATLKEISAVCVLPAGKEAWLRGIPDTSSDTHIDTRIRIGNMLNCRQGGVAARQPGQLADGCRVDLL